MYISLQWSHRKSQSSTKNVCNPGFWWDDRNIQETKNIPSTPRAVPLLCKYVLPYHPLLHWQLPLQQLALSLSPMDAPVPWESVFGYGVGSLCSIQPKGAAFIGSALVPAVISPGAVENSALCSSICAIYSSNQWASTEFLSVFSHPTQYTLSC